MQFTNVHKATACYCTIEAKYTVKVKFTLEYIQGPSKHVMLVTLRTKVAMYDPAQVLLNYILHFGAKHLERALSKHLGVQAPPIGMSCLLYPA